MGDFQVAFNIAIGVIGVLAGWLMRIMWTAQRELRQDLRQLEQGLPNTYARRDDVQSLTEALFKKFDRIEDKIDKLAAKTLNG